MTRISYAQNGEDVVLYRAFGQQSKGFYIDIGANDPDTCSVTRLFWEAGWRGINVEPVPALAERLRTARPRDVNLAIGLSNQCGTLRFFEAESPSTLSTFSPEAARLLRGRGITFREREVPILTLAEVCERFVKGPIDFMSIDVEDHELEVIQGGDWARWRPRVVLVEDYISATGRPNHHKYEPPLVEAGYLPALFDGINRFYVRQEDEHLLPLLSIPANSQDGFLPAGYARIPEVGPTSLAIAHRLHRLGQRFPRTGTLVKRVLHQVVKKAGLAH
jgi:FkbM family methyltransferase